MRYLALTGAVLAAFTLAGCGSDDPAAPPAATAAASAASTSATTAGSANYAGDARTLLTDLGTAQRGLADALAANAPLSDAWKQGVTARVTALAAIEERAQKLVPPAAQQSSNTQLLLAIRRTREAADTISVAVSEGNVSMLERANSLLSDAAFQTSAAVAVLPR